MYSHGSSARAGVGGKRGHGGREYRPPRPRRDPKATPPPLKACGCLCQLDLSESQVARPRNHYAFQGGRQGLNQLERDLRSLFCVHLVVPGRKQTGPVAIVGATYHQALPATMYLLERLVYTEQNESAILPGRIQKCVQDPNDRTIEGYWVLPSATAASSRNKPQWIFQSSQWSVMGCQLVQRSNCSSNDGETDHENSDNRISNTAGSTGVAFVEDKNSQIHEVLRNAVDNLQFRIGQLEGLDIFLHEDPAAAFGAGNPQLTGALYDQVDEALQRLVGTNVDDKNQVNS